MSQPVIIKSNKYGINLILDPDIPFEELLGHITDKFLESERFFRNAHMAISFDGRKLSGEEEYQILDTISHKTSIHVVCIIDNDEIREQYTKQKGKPSVFLFSADFYYCFLYYFISFQTGYYDFFTANGK